MNLQMLKRSGVFLGYLGEHVEGMDTAAVLNYLACGMTTDSLYYRSRSTMLHQVPMTLTRDIRRLGRKENRHNVSFTICMPRLGKVLKYLFITKHHISSMVRRTHADCRHEMRILIERYRVF